MNTMNKNMKKSYQNMIAKMPFAPKNEMDIFEKEKMIPDTY